MKKLLTLLAVCAIVSGCKSTVANYNAKTGDWKISDRRGFLKTEAEIVATVDTAGNKSVSIKAKSDPANEAIKAAAEGIATGLGKTMKPTP